MRSATLSLVFMAAIFALSGGCCSSKYPAFSCNQETVYGHPFPRQWSDDFYEIRGDYIRGYWDCDDMAQVYSEYLNEQGVEWKDMRLVSAVGFWLNPITKKIEVDPFRGPHMWVEARLFGEWWVFDMSARKWAWRFERGKRPLNWAQYDIYEFDDAGGVVWDGSGYRMRGDRFDHEKLVWVGKDGREYSVDERTTTIGREGVKSDLEALRKKRGSTK